MKDLRKTIGNFGESVACDFLKKHGYKIINRNVKLSYLEIDIVAEKNKNTFFIEVKTRTTKNLGLADQALRKTQIKKLKKAIVSYSFQNKINLNNIQLDFISIDLDKENKTASIKHYKNIF